MPLVLDPQQQAALDAARQAATDAIAERDAAEVRVRRLSAALNRTGAVRLSDESRGKVLTAWLLAAWFGLALGAVPVVFSDAPWWARVIGGVTFGAPFAAPLVVLGFAELHKSEWHQRGGTFRTSPRAAARQLPSAEQKLSEARVAAQQAIERLNDLRAALAAGATGGGLSLAGDGGELALVDDGALALVDDGAAALADDAA